MSKSSTQIFCAKLIYVNVKGDEQIVPLYISQYESKRHIHDAGTVLISFGII